MGALLYWCELLKFIDWLVFVILIYVETCMTKGKILIVLRMSTSTSEAQLMRICSCDQYMHLSIIMASWKIYMLSLKQFRRTLKRVNNMNLRILFLLYLFISLILTFWVVTIILSFIGVCSYQHQILYFTFVPWKF